MAKSWVEEHYGVPGTPGYTGWMPDALPVFSNCTGLDASHTLAIFRTVVGRYPTSNEIARYACIGWDADRLTRQLTAEFPPPPPPAEKAKVSPLAMAAGIAIVVALAVK